MKGNLAARKALPGIRHKRITEDEFNRYLGANSIQSGGAFASVPAKPMCNQTATPPARPAGLETATDKSLVKPTAKVVASPVALASQRKSRWNNNKQWKTSWRSAAWSSPSL